VAAVLDQEAAQIRSAHALRRDDFVFSSCREHTAAYVRGVALLDPEAVVPSLNADIRTARSCSDPEAR
jgi:TPP-dependent pyruvate/acetoin dehydrogenase alpha subunit